jgi:hypothetical protein
MSIYSTRPTDPVTPNKFRKAQKHARELWAAYVEARRALLRLIPLYRKAVALLDEPWTAWPSKATVEQRIALESALKTRRDAENAMSEMWDARRWAYDALDTVASYERRGVVKGSAMCPAAQERARRAGRLT